MFIGSDAMNAGNRSGCLRQTSASASLANRTSSGDLSGPAISSGGGLASEMTCCISPNSSISRSRASRSTKGCSRGNAVSTGWPGMKSPRRSKYALGMKWLKMSMIIAQTFIPERKRKEAPEKPPVSFRGAPQARTRNPETSLNPW